MKNFVMIEMVEIGGGIGMGMTSLSLPYPVGMVKTTLNTESELTA